MLKKIQTKIEKGKNEFENVQKRKREKTDRTRENRRNRKTKKNTQKLCHTMLVLRHKGVVSVLPIKWIALGAPLGLPFPLPTVGPIFYSRCRIRGPMVVQRAKSRLLCM
jgi:hypothetical protein